MKLALAPGILVEIGDLPTGPSDPMMLISRTEVADAARAVADDYGLIGTAEADRLSQAFDRFAEKIENLP